MNVTDSFIQAVLVWKIAYNSGTPQESYIALL